MILKMKLKVWVMKKLMSEMKVEIEEEEIVEGE